MNLNKALAEAIAKGVARVNRKPITNLRRDMAQLKREVAELKRLVRDLRGQSMTAVEPDLKEQGALKIRPTSKAVLKLRKKLGLTQAQLAALIGVSTLTVCKWEKTGGRIRMRGPGLAGFTRVRAMGKRELKRALQETVSSGK